MKIVDCVVFLMYMLGFICVFYACYSVFPPLAYLVSGWVFIQLASNLLKNKGGEK
ncbi:MULTISPECIES: hypothetical protein [unclassified Granulicatella]|uniref:hypothetical protein n=1 Tax=unclassified Granulicatella TaxID=2630493 RepID=UPI001430EF2E|nr:MULTISPECIES: hypothetical protein [unclassified Granulicatella]MBF0780505.1 hypothetical protein [Granulicatella sp. 19428wC4_WM01]